MTTSGGTLLTCTINTVGGDPAVGIGFPAGRAARSDPDRDGRRPVSSGRPAPAPDERFGGVAGAFRSGRSARVTG
ncbi:hypothetical protein CIK06_23980 [Plantactinospora sp. KBS50]|nr:hypothetical protein CIK06_23980 [Plantactinospora sp. KBS50]